MPLSPFIRPLSPLQTQFAPSLPEPCSLADAALPPLPAETSATLTGAWDHGASSAPVSAAVASESRPSFRAMCLSAAGVAHSPPETMPAPAPPPLRTQTLAPTFHSMVGEALSLEMLRDSYTAQLQRNFQHRPAVEALRGTPDGAAARVRSRLSNDAVATQAPSAKDAIHRGPRRHALLPSPASSSSVHPYVSAATACTIAAHRKRADGPPPAETPLSLLHSAAATVMAAARPSYGVALIRNCSPAKRADQKEPYSSHLRAQRELQRSSFQSLFERRPNDRREAESPTSSLSSFGCASTAIKVDEMNPFRPSAPVPFTTSVTRRRGAAPSDRTTRSRAVSIEACPVLGKGGESAAASDAAGSGARASKARVFSGHVNLALLSAQASELGKRKADAFAAPSCCPPHGAFLGRKAEEETVDEEEAEKFFDSPHVPAKEALRAMQSESAAALLRKTAQGKQGTTTGSAPRTTKFLSGVTGAPENAAAPSPAVEPHPPRYVYPALEECRRLLDEIRIVSPLLRRCLTPPRPLDSSSGSGGIATVASAPSTFSPVRVPSRNIPASSQSTIIPSYSAATTAVVSPEEGYHAPRPEARRLYHWDAAAASEDLSFMRGPFQQPTERFAISVARQLQRLQAVGTRLYGKAHDTWASRAEMDAPSRRSRPLPSSGPLTSSWGSATPHFVVNQCDRAGNNNKESPSRRLRRLLRETEAALPSLLERKAEPPLFSAPTAFAATSFPSTINRARSSRDGSGYCAHYSVAAARPAGVSESSMESTFTSSAISGCLTAARPLMLSPLPRGE
ncbi:hypothetical protein CUR178_00218 [Leishmania enriettii]|uniref:Uncharacterized protein n=1 Tax=Leishmania enriettii TaxID=5663 RepID=A0A836GKH7_LEIEN|nr:hypothetical protein CUR178_00218 [Leishmania enriettii]